MKQQTDRQRRPRGDRQRRAGQRSPCPRRVGGLVGDPSREADRSLVAGEIAHAAGLPFPAPGERVLDGAPLHRERRMRQRRGARRPPLSTDRRAGGSVGPR